MAATVAPPDTPQAPHSDKSFWASWKTLASLVLVGMVIVAAVWLVLDDPDRPDASRPGSGQVDQQESDACGPEGTGSQVPPSAAPDTRWALLGSMAAPRAADIGPADDVDGVPLCFAPDPTGALFAAATFVAANSDPDLRLPVLTKMVVRDAGYQAAKADILSRGPGPATHGVQIAGFASPFPSYEKGRSAVVDLALFSEGVYVHVPIQLAWTDGDWRVVLPPTGRPFDPMDDIPNLTGYVPWQGA